MFACHRSTYNSSTLKQRSLVPKQFILLKIKGLTNDEAQIYRKKDVIIIIASKFVIILFNLISSQRQNITKYFCNTGMIKLIICLSFHLTYLPFHLVAHHEQIALLSGGGFVSACQTDRQSSLDADADPLRVASAGRVSVSDICPAPAPASSSLFKVCKIIHLNPLHR